MGKIKDRRMAPICMQERHSEKTDGAHGLENANDRNKTTMVATDFVATKNK